MKNYKRGIVIGILFIFILNIFHNILNYIFYILNARIGGYVDIISILILIVICIPLTIKIINFLLE